MKKILVITNYWHFKEEKDNSRYSSLCDLMVANGYDVEVITSSFYHLHKKHRNLNNKNLLNLPYKVTLLNEPGYKKNISISRLLSHKVLASNLNKYLKDHSTPDIIFSVVPSLDVAYSAEKYAKKNNIPLILDIQDLWPEAFKMAFDIPIISNILFLPMKKRANYIYKNADKIVAVSQTYVDRALKYNKKDTKGLSVYIGADAKKIDEIINKAGEIRKEKGEFWIGYIGTLGYSYDLRVVIDALAICKEKGYNNFVLKVMGKGPLEKKFKEYAEKRRIAADFTGFLSYEQMIPILNVCDIAVNPIVGKSVSSIINKVADYALTGKPVINTQNSKEYRDLLENYNAGINCENGNSYNVAEAIISLYNDGAKLQTMSNNAYRMGKELFDRNLTYNAIINLIENLIQEK